MKEPKRLTATRGAGLARLARWMLLALLGAMIGLILGDIAAGKRLGRTQGWNGSYAELSANPDAATANALPALSCSNCADSYGVAVRLRAERAERENDAYRKLGAVDLDWPVPMPEDEYRYGGRFPDPEAAAAPVARTTATVTADPTPFVDPPAGEDREPR